MSRNHSATGLCASVFFLMLGVGMAVTLLPVRILELDGTITDTAALASFFAVPYVLLQLPMGSVADRIGFKPLLIFGFLTCCLAGLIYHSARSVESVFVGRILQGVGEAPVWALAPALLASGSASSAIRSIGFYNASLHLGLTSGPFLATLFSRMRGPNLSFLTYAACCLLGAFLIHLMVTDAPKRRPQKNMAKEWHGIIRILLNGQNRRVLLGILLYGAGYGVFLTVIPGYLISRRGFDGTHIAVVVTLFYLAISVVQALTGSLTRHGAPRRLMAGGLLLASAGFAAFPFLKTPLLEVALTVASLGFGAFHLASMARLTAEAPAAIRGAASGAYYLQWGTGLFLCPPLLSLMGEAVGFEAAFATLSAGLLGAVTAIAFMGGERKRRSVT